LVGIEPIPISTRRAFVSDQITERKDRDRQAFYFDGLPLLISVIELDAAYSGDYVNPPRCYTYLEYNVGLGKRCFVDLMELGTKRHH
jgi:hypothetical protein